MDEVHIATKVRMKGESSMALEYVTGMKGLEEEQKKAEAKAKGSGGNFLFLADGESQKFYFMHDPDVAVGYYEHVFQDKGGWQYIPCPENCKLCASEDDNKTKKSFRVAYLVMPADDRKALVLKANTDLNSTILNRFERRGTMMDKPYILTRLGTGIDTKYDLEIDDGKKLPKDALKKLGITETPTKYLQNIFEGQIDRYYGGGKDQQTNAQAVEDMFEEDEAEPAEPAKPAEPLEPDNTATDSAENAEEEEW